MSFRKITQVKLLLEILIEEWFSSVLHTDYFRQKLFLIKKQKSL